MSIHSHSSHSTHGRPSQRSQHHYHHHSSTRTSSNVAGDPQLAAWFESVDTDRSGAISVRELQSALVNGNWTHFDLDTCQMLMNMFDSDRSGTIGFHEFSGLWKYISEWQDVFRKFDSDQSGSIDGQELGNALRAFGYNLSPEILNLIEKKYASPPDSDFADYAKHPRTAGITFDRFVRACVVIRSLTDSFAREDTDRDGWAYLNYETFMRIVLSAP